jgi:hypothetical protein
MNESVTIELPGELAARARAVAIRTQRSLEDVLLEWLDRASADVPVDQLSDDQVLGLRDLRLSDEQQTSLSELLACQREGTPDSPGRQRLDALLSLYRRDMVRKAEALKVAVERGLQPPLS